ncbi:MAG: hypothetical protein QOF48_3134 [Verrucomicrobiota bacterium]|jgi:hypothetical protein
MRENRLSGLEGGVALTRHPYPYRRARDPKRSRSLFSMESRLQAVPAA